MDELLQKEKEREAKELQDMKGLVGVPMKETNVDNIKLFENALSRHQ